MRDTSRIACALVQRGCHHDQGCSSFLLHWHGVKWFEKVPRGVGWFQSFSGFQLPLWTKYRLGVPALVPTASRLPLPVRLPVRFLVRFLFRSSVARGGFEAERTYDTKTTPDFQERYIPHVSSGSVWSCGLACVRSIRVLRGKRRWRTHLPSFGMPASRAGPDIL